jgi:hypothetical protein
MEGFGAYNSIRVWLGLGQYSGHKKGFSLSLFSLFKLSLRQILINFDFGHLCIFLILSFYTSTFPACYVLYQIRRPLGLAFVIYFWWLGDLLPLYI